jgi:hypothetical protein
MMREQKFLMIVILATVVSLSAAVAGVVSVNAQNMSGNATGGNMTNATAGD